MDLDFSKFGKFKIIQDDGNWIDSRRFESAVNYWGRYFNHLRVKGTLVHEPGEMPDPVYILDPMRIVIKGHTSITVLAMLFAAVKCGHTLYFDNANNLTSAWYKKVKPTVIMVGSEDLVLPGGRYEAGPDKKSVRLIFHRSFVQYSEPYEYPDECKEYQNMDGVIIEHRDTKLHKYKKSNLDELIKSFSAVHTPDGKSSVMEAPAVAYIEQDTRNQVSQLVNCILPLMYAGSKIVLDTGVRTFDWKQAIEIHKPNLVYWGVKIKQAIDKKDPWCTSLSPAPLFYPHIRKEKVVKKEEAKLEAEFIKEPD